MPVLLAFEGVCPFAAHDQRNHTGQK